MTDVALTPARLTRLFARITTPAAASKACSRVYALSQRATGVKAIALLDLSEALNEHRHVILCEFRGDAKGASEHLANRADLVRQACHPVTSPAEIRKALSAAIACHRNSIPGTDAAREAARAIVSAVDQHPWLRDQVPEDRLGMARREALGLSPVAAA